MAEVSDNPNMWKSRLVNQYANSSILWNTFLQNINAQDYKILYIENFIESFRIPIITLFSYFTQQKLLEIKRIHRIFSTQEIENLIYQNWETLNNEEKSRLKKKWNPKWIIISFTKI